MSTTLTNGLKLPDKGSVDWYADMQNNYTILDGAVGTIAEHTSALSGKAPLAHTHTKSDVTDLFNSANTWTGDNTFKGNIYQNQGDANYIIPRGTNTVKGDLTTLGSFTLMFKDKNNGNLATSGIGYLTFGQNSSGSYTIIGVETVGSTDNTRHSNSISFRIDPTTNDNTAQFYPVNNNATDLGDSTHQWNNLYARRTNTSLIKAATGDLIIQSNGTNKSVAIYNGTLVGDGGGIWLYGKDHENGSKVRLQIYNTTTSGFEGVDLSGSSLYPVPNKLLNLGTSTNKWKSLNGINPGALSLPDTLGTSGTENVNYFNVIGYLNNTGTVATIPSTATYDGWLYINAKDGADSYIIIDDYPASFGTSVFGNNGLGSQSIGLLCLMCPIRKGHSYNVRIKSAGIVSARIYPAQGNV